MEKLIEKAKKIIKEKPELFAALEEFDKTGKLKKLKYKERCTFTVDEDLIIRFRAYCKKHNLRMSNLIEEMIRKKLS